jgi:rhamnulokinase
MLELHGKFFWNIFGLFESIKDGLRACVKEGVTPDTIGIDTWGVDFGFVGADGVLTGLPRAYRDPFTDQTPEELFHKIGRDEVYQLTGIQIMNFNSLFQLRQEILENYTPLAAADKILFMPDLISYMLTGEQVCEYTVASTSQLINPITRDFESTILKTANINPNWLQPTVQPGTLVGLLADHIAKETGIGKIPVVTVAGHDTASAVVAVPANEKEFAYLNSGTWSLMGVELDTPIITAQSYQHNFANEGGIEGTSRFLKNITGMWLIEQCRKEWKNAGRDYSYGQLEEIAESLGVSESIINPDDPQLLHPDSMTGAITQICHANNLPVPVTDAEFTRCIFDSLAQKYKITLHILNEIIPFEIKKLHVIGGGANNKLLNQLTADAIGMPVVAGPTEATAIGNCLVQAKAAGLVKDRWEIREVVAQSFPLQVYLPKLMKS